MVLLSVVAIATIVVLSKCVELTREGIYIDLRPCIHPTVKITVRHGVDQ